ncbi:MAG: hypothetical protein QOE92_2037 [Chloroflexota bacterium]|jgi:hypothetical protein|nr:hypothetical protein [Chloroflexota bacterium]
MKRNGLICAVALLLAGVPGIMTMAPFPAAASNPATGTLSYDHPEQVFTNASPMTGAIPAGFVQSRCTLEPTGCDRVTIDIDATLNGELDHQAVVSINFTTSAGADMAVASFPEGCDPDDVTGSCAPYYQTDPPWTMGDPGHKTYTFEIACGQCANATYEMKFTIAHVTFDLPPAGDTGIKFDVTPFAEVASTTGQLTGQFGEPGIDINRNGYGIINSFGPTVWYTHDSGVTWSDSFDVYAKDTVCPDGYAADADAVVGIDDTFYADNLCVGTAGGVNNESFTNTHLGDPGPGGANWEGPFLAGGNSDRQWYATDPTDPNVLYLSYHDFGGPNINIFKSTDHGHNWFCPTTGNPATITGACGVTLTNGQNGVAPSGVETGAGNTSTRPLIDPTNPQVIYVPYGDTSLVNAVLGNTATIDYDLSRLLLAKSTDGGVTWASNSDPTGQGFVLDANGAFEQKTDADNTVGHLFISAAIDRAGNLYYVFSLRQPALDETNTHTHLYLISSQDKGETWSQPTRIDKDDLPSNVFPWVTAGDPGRVAVSWYGSHSQDFNDPASQWGEMFAVSTNALSANPTFAQSRIGGEQQPVHIGDVCQVGLNCTVSSGNRNLSDYQMIDVDPCGRAHPVWTNDFGPGLTVTAIQTSGPLLYADDPCHLASAPTTVDTQSPPTQQLPNTAAGVRPALLVLGTGALVMGLIGVRTRRRRRARA